jgi:3-phenylpropionate/cinnamic acid dioxygenase small subunit
MNTASTIDASDYGRVDYPWPDENQIPIGNATYNEVLQFLYNEARLLDRGEVVRWSKMLAQDLIYTVPIRVTRLAKDPQSGVVGPGHYDEDYASIQTRIARLTETKSFWAEDPPSRTRRFVTNVLVYQDSSSDRLFVTSDLLLMRSRLEMVNFHPLSAERRDILRREDDGLKLVRREVIIDHSVVMMQNLAIFL